MFGEGLERAYRPLMEWLDGAEPGWRDVQEPVDMEPCGSSYCWCDPGFEDGDA